MIQKTLIKRVRDAHSAGRRLVAPLMGFPGLRLAGTTVKIAQQNYGKHYEVLKALVTKFRPDIVFPLMDLTVEANALGKYTLFPKHDSPTVIKGHFEITELKLQESIRMAFDVRVLGYVETIKLTSINFPKDVLKGAYVTGLYTLAGLLMGAEEAAMAAVSEPEKLSMLCEFTTEKIHEFVKLLIGAGAQVVCILEPSAVMLGADQFEQFSCRFVRHISDSCKYADVATLYHICGNAMHLVDKMVDSHVDAISLDSPESGVDLPSIAERVDGKAILFGNINPIGSILKSTPETVEEDVKRLLKAMAPHQNFVLSTGCDLPQGTPFQNIEAFMRAGRDWRMNGA